jgi:hypothetical protein
MADVQGRFLVAVLVSFFILTACGSFDKAPGETVVAGY